MSIVKSGPVTGETVGPSWGVIEAEVTLDDDRENMDAWGENCDERQPMLGVLYTERFPSRDWLLLLSECRLDSWLWCWCFPFPLWCVALGVMVVRVWPLLSSLLLVVVLLL